MKKKQNKKKERKVNRHICYLHYQVVVWNYKCISSNTFHRIIRKHSGKEIEQTIKNSIIFAPSASFRLSRMGLIGSTPPPRGSLYPYYLNFFKICFDKEIFKSVLNFRSHPFWMVANGIFDCILISFSSYAKAWAAFCSPFVAPRCKKEYSKLLVFTYQIHRLLTHLAKQLSIASAAIINSF